LPSTSVSTAPSAWAMAMGVTAGTPFGTARVRRASSAWLAGPGIVVLSLMVAAIRRLVVLKLVVNVVGRC